MWHDVAAPQTEGAAGRHFHLRMRGQRWSEQSQWWPVGARTSSVGFSDGSGNLSEDAVTAENPAVAEKREERPVFSHRPPDTRRCLTLARSPGRGRGNGLRWSASLATEQKNWTPENKPRWGQARYNAAWRHMLPCSSVHGSWTLHGGRQGTLIPSAIRLY